MLTSTYKKLKDWKIIFSVFLVIILSMIIYGWFDGYWSKNIYSPKFGTLGHPLYFGTALLFSIMSISYLLFVQKKTINLRVIKKYPFIQKILLAILLFCSLIALIQTHTRGPTLGLISGLLLAISLYFYFKPKYIIRYKKHIAIILVLLLIVSGIFYYVRINNISSNNPIVERFINISLNDKSIQTRLWTWNSAWQGFKEKPILGWGPENFDIVFNKYFNLNHFEDPNSETWFNRAHNIILDTLISGGLIGLISYLSIFTILIYFIFSKIIKNQKDIPLGIWAISSLAAYFVQNLSGFDTISSYLCFYMLIGFINYESKDFPSLNYSKINKNKLLLKYFLATPLIIFIFYNLHWGNYIPYKTNKNIISTFKLNNQDNLSASFNLYKENIKLDSKFTISDTRKMFVQIIYSNYEKNISKKEISPKSAIAIKEIEKDIDQHPLGGKNYAILGKLYRESGRYLENKKYIIKSEEIFKKGLEISPNRPEYIFGLANTYVILKKDSQALDLLKNFQKQKPNNKYINNLINSIQKKP